MKRKLNTVFILMAFSLLGIIIFQIYWTANAYQVNKEKFDTNINGAMQNAMDDCKKDYFDSIRRVLVKHLSPPETIIRIDTPQPNPQWKTQYTTYDIRFLHKNTLPGEPYRTSKSNLDFYRKKINHNATIPEVLTEMSFYVPQLMTQITTMLRDGIYGPMFTNDDIHRHPEFFRDIFFKGKPLVNTISYYPPSTLSPLYQHIRDSVLTAYFKHKPDNNQPVAQTNALPLHLLKPAPAISKKKPGNPPNDYNSGYEAGRKAAMLATKNTILEWPPNYRRADSIKLHRYFQYELEKAHIYSPFSLVVSGSSSSPSKLNLHYSETGEVDYKYHGFRVFDFGPQDLFFRAKFPNAQYGVLKRMLLTLSFSLFLILFTMFCFNYIFRTFIEQKKLAELKDDFINNMTHELKTPIATITVAIEGLQKFNVLDDAGKTQRYLQTSRNELARLNGLVTKVLDIAAFENKEIKLVKEQVNVEELINDVIASEKLKTTKKVDISFINKGDFDTINVDKFHFRNVLINLVDNAVKYSNEPVAIVISSYKNGHLHCISVKDNGIGIPQAHTGLIFDKFHRVPTGNVHSVKGTGLGLSYVKYMVEAHGGSITVKSEINKGSEFIVSIP